MGRKSYTKGFVTVYAAKFGEKFMYIGCTQKKLSARVADHLYEAVTRNSKLIFHKWLRKNKDKVTFETICQAVTREEAFEKEAFYIKVHGTHESLGGLNATFGGLGMRRAHSKETIRKISKTKSNFFKTNPGPNKGRRFDENTKLNMSLGASERKKEVLCLNTGEVFKSLFEASKKMGIPKSSISRVCNGQRNSVFGYKFTYLETEGADLSTGG